MQRLILLVRDAVITKNNGCGSKIIDKGVIWRICDQAGEIVNAGNGCTIVVSGAIACDANINRSKPLRSVVGNASLCNRYNSYLRIFDIDSGPRTFTKNDLASPELASVFEESFRSKVVILVNAEDCVDSAEYRALDFGVDNLSLFEDICRLIQPDIAIVLEQPGFDPECLASTLPAEVLTRLSAYGIYGALVPVSERNFILRAFNREEGFGTVFFPVR